MANANKTKEKKPNIFRRIGAKFKEVFSELKRVTWPKLPTVVKTTGVDALLNLLLKLLVAK